MYKNAILPQSSRALFPQERILFKRTVHGIMSGTGIKPFSKILFSNDQILTLFRFSNSQSCVQILKLGHIKRKML